MSNLFKKLFFQGDTWKIAYRKTDSNLFDDKTTPFNILEIPKGFWGADPFLIRKDEKYFVIFELTNFKKRKSLLGSKELFSSSKNINIIYEFPYHSSYPCIFNKGSELYIIPETIQNKDVVLLKCIKWPNEWKKEKILLTDSDLVDSTIRNEGENLFLLTYNLVDFKTQVFKFDSNFNIVGNPVKTIKSDENIFRPAGNFIELSNDEYIRPVQPSNKFYGEKVVFLKGDKNWDEKAFCSIDIHDIKLNEKKKKKYIGIHTYNKLDSIEVIDIAEMSFRPFKIFEFLFRKLNLFGYSLYDKKQKCIQNELDPKQFNKTTTKH